MSVERTQEFHLGFSRTNLHVLHRTSATGATYSWMRIFLKQDSFFTRIGLILSTQITSKSGKRDCVVFAGAVFLRSGLRLRPQESG